MATSKELRVENLRSLVKEFKTADAVAQLAKTNPMYLSQILNGAKSSTGTPRGVGDKLARKIEEGCGKPVGWMDEEHQDDGFIPAAVGDAERMLPDGRLVTVSDDVKAGMFPVRLVNLRLQAGFPAFDADRLFDEGASVQVSESWMEKNGLVPACLIAIKVRGDSMEPMLFEDDVVVINIADTKPMSGNVYAINFDGQAVVKQMLYAENDWWMHSFNPAHKRKRCRSGECIVIGKMVHRGGSSMIGKL